MSRRQWAGLWKSQLPFESSYSLLVGFADANVFNLTTLYWHMCGVYGVSRDVPFISKKWAKVAQDSANFYKEVGWKFPKNEIEISKILSWQFGERTLRICPLCFQYGYHSYLFQFKPLWLCPVHHCKLTTECSSCGAGLPTYAFNRQLFDTHYLCSRCGDPMSGGEHCRELRLDFESQKELLFSRLKPLEDWMLSLANSGVMGSVRLQSTLAGHPDFWTNCEDLTIRIAHAIRPIPSVCQSVPEGGVTLLTWGIRRRAPPESEAAANRLATSVYRVTLRLLQQWIKLQGGGISSMADQRDPDFHEKGIVSFGYWNRYELAYMMFRSAMEIDQEWGLDSSVANARFEPHFVWSKKDLFCGRRMWRGRLLAIFSGLVHLISRGERNGFLNLREIASFRGLAPEFYFPGKDVLGGHEGVVFPTVPGLPVGRAGCEFSRHPSGIPHWIENVSEHLCLHHTCKMFKDAS